MLPSNVAYKLKKGEVILLNFHMINITEDGRYYSAFDRQVHEDARPFYVDNWIWDTFRALEPLGLLLDPAMEADQLQSYVRMYEQSGWMPSFAVLWGDYACMNGNHAAGWFADAWFKGVRNDGVVPCPQLLLNVRVKEKPDLRLHATIGPGVAEIERALDGTGRVVLRYPGTEPLARVMVEGTDAGAVRSLAERLVGVIRSEIGE